MNPSYRFMPSTPWTGGGVSHQQQQQQWPLPPRFPLPPPPLFIPPVINRNNFGLQIRNLSPAIGYAERDQVFYGLGATSVHNYPFYTIAYFPDDQTCHSVIRQLHQRQWTPGNATSKRLRVEFLPRNSTESRIVNSHTVCDSSLKQSIQKAQEECFNSSVKAAKQSSVNLLTQSNFPNFCFPPPTQSVIRRIGVHLLNNQHFYHHVLLLMVKLGLKPPFDQDNPDDNLNIDVNDIPLPNKRPRDELLASDESELESDHEVTNNKKLVNNFNHLPKKRKTTKSLKTGFVGEKANDLPLNKCPKNSTAKLTTTIEPIFESTSLKQRTFQIKVANEIHRNAVLDESVDNVESFGTIEPPVEKPVKAVQKPTTSFDLATLTRDDILSDDAVRNNRISIQQRKDFKVYGGYKLNPVCNRLYVKNLHKTTTLRQLYCLFGRYIDLCNEDHLNGFDIVKLDRGRMHGQAFVTFPSEEIAEKALKETDGYVMHRDEEGKPRPIVVNFALSKK